MNQFGDVFCLDWDLEQETWQLDDLLALPVHPACKAIPRHTADELRGMANDLCEGGVGSLLTCPIIANGQLIDGRGRLKACKREGVSGINVFHLKSGDNGEPVTDDLIARIVLSLNLHRRQLSAEQRADIVVRFKGKGWLQRKTEEGKVAMSVGWGDQKSPHRKKKSVSAKAAQPVSAAAEVAKEAKVSERTAKKALAKARREAGLSAIRMLRAETHVASSAVSAESVASRLVQSMGPKGAKEWLDDFKRISGKAFISAMEEQLY